MSTLYNPTLKLQKIANNLTSYYSTIPQKNNYQKNIINPKGQLSRATGGLPGFPLTQRDQSSPKGWNPSIAQKQKKKSISKFSKTQMYQVTVVAESSTHSTESPNHKYLQHSSQPVCHCWVQPMFHLRLHRRSATCAWREAPSEVRPWPTLLHGYGPTACILDFEST